MDAELNRARASSLVGSLLDLLACTETGPNGPYEMRTKTVETTKFGTVVLTAHPSGGPIPYWEQVEATTDDSTVRFIAACGESAARIEVEGEQIDPAGLVGAIRGAR